VGAPVLRDSFKPDDFVLEPVTVKTPSAKTKPSPSTRVARGLFLRRFRPPLSTQVRLRDGAPSLVQNSRFNASIVRSAGPFRASGQWWENLWSREEWDIETKQGDLLRLVREDQQWFIDGAYD
jgi:protein ImuB